MFSNQKALNEAIQNKKPTIALCLADWCTHCTKLKESVPYLLEAAKARKINLMPLSVTDEENEEFLKANPFETLPYFLVFADGEFKGGDEASKESLEYIINALADLELQKASQ